MKKDKKQYEGIIIIPTDKRTFDIVFRAKNRPVITNITQLDLLQIHSYLSGKNQRLCDKIRRFILACDEENTEKTDFKRRLPRRGIHEQF